jgi:D-arabinono-1,4-lactone oxidase
MGIDPYDPTSTDANSFFRCIDREGYAVPLTGGISHQTIGGFLSTGTSGSSLRFCLTEFIDEIEFIDGNGEI